MKASHVAGIQVSNFICSTIYKKYKHTYKTKMIQCCINEYVSMIVNSYNRLSQMLGRFLKVMLGDDQDLGFGEEAFC